MKVAQGLRRGRKRLGQRADRVGLSWHRVSEPQEPISERSRLHRRWRGDAAARSGRLGARVAPFRALFATLRLGRAPLRARAWAFASWACRGRRQAPALQLAGLLLGLVAAVSACHRQPPRVLPADELPRPAEVLHARIAPGERLTDDAVAEALLSGAYCYPLPGAARHSLWWHAELARLELTEQAEDGHWRRVAVNLPTGASAIVAEPVDSGTGLPLDATLDDEPALPQPPEHLRVIHVPQGQTWLVRSDGKSETLLEPTRAGPVEVVTVTPVWLQAAATVPGGVVAALLRQDTDGDGQPSAEDEADLCLIARALTPVQVAERHVPLARLAVAEQVRALANAALAAAVTDRWLKHDHRLQLRFAGACALDAPAVTDRLVELHDAVTRVVGEMDLSLEVRCTPGDPTAAAQ